MPDVFNEFVIEEREGGLVIVDADGSVYDVLFDAAQRGERLPPAATGTTAGRTGAGVRDQASGGFGLAFEAIGIYRPSGEWLVWKGRMIPDRASSVPVATALAGSGSVSPGAIAAVVQGHYVIRGEVEYGTHGRFPVEAVPEGKRLSQIEHGVSHPDRVKPAPPGWGSRSRDL